MLSGVAVGRDALEALVARAQEGDVAAFEQIVALEASNLFRVASAIVGPGDANDMTQEAFVQAWRSLRKLRRPDQFLPWVRKILLNKCLNHLRDRSRHRTVSLDLTPTDPVQPRDPDRALDIAEALSMLPARQRAVVALHYVADLPIREVARQLGIPQGTAQSRLHGALRTLRSVLREETQ